MLEHPRLARLPAAEVLGYAARVATDRRSRLLGLSLLERAGVERGLLIPRCSSIHTWGMRFRIDVVFLDADGLAIRVCRGVSPRRFLRERKAAAVLELPSGEGDGDVFAISEKSLPSEGWNGSP